jgi:hypothetical protein
MTNNDILNFIETNDTINFKNTLFGTTNAKLKKQNIASFDLPQGHTCHSNNYEASLKDSFVNEANQSIKALPNIKFYRVHSSGDYYNKKYIAKWLEIAKENPTKIFYSYTKSIILFKGLELPENLIIIQSEGTKKDSVYLDYSKTFARIFEDKNELLDAVNSGKYIDASKNDLNAVKAALTGKNIALLKH